MGKPKKKTRLRLFVWTDFSPDHTSGLAFAIANDEAEARRLIEAERGYQVYEWGVLTTCPLSRKIARSVSGGG